MNQMITTLFTFRQQGPLQERKGYRLFQINIGFSSGKHILLTLMGICISLMVNAQVLKSVELTPGSLSSVLTTTELGTVTNLTLTGTIDARDFKIMRDEMPLLSELDLSGISIASYSGDGGSMVFNNIYEANYIPAYLFNNPYTHTAKVSLTKVILPSTIASIGYGAFWGCTALSFINLPSSIHSISAFAFKNCSSLTSITIPSSITYIDESTFENCSGLISVNIPSLVNSIGKNAFGQINASIKVDSNNSEYSDREGILYNKSQTTLIQCPISKTGDFIIPPGVLSIGESAFKSCTYLTSITITSSVTSIGNRAFENCSNVSSIYVYTLSPINLSSSTNVFYNVKPTTKLYVPYGSKMLFASADRWYDFINIIEMPGIFLSKNSLTFGYNENTATVNIRSNADLEITSNQPWLIVSSSSNDIGETIVNFIADENNTAEILKATVTISAEGFDDQFISVTKLGKVSVIAGGLQNSLADLLGSVSSLTLTGNIDARDFKTMRDNIPLLSVLDLSEVKIKSYSGSAGTSETGTTYYSADEIPEQAFYKFTKFQGKTSLTSITLPSTVKSIGSMAFGMCSGLTSVAIPNSLTSIGNNAFSNCKGLTSIVLPSSIINLGDGTFEMCSGLTSINIPTSITSIGYYTFQYCTGLTLINIPSSVTSIGLGAFRGSGLTSINIPRSVTSIGSIAFNYCDDVTSVNANSNIPINLGPDPVFSATTPTTAILTVPYGSKVLYAAANQWKDFTNIVEAPDRAPVASAGLDHAIFEGALETLVGTGSTDEDGNTLTYKWVSPEGITLSSTTAPNPTFTAPEAKIDTDYTFSLIVNDGLLNSTSAKIVITIKHINKVPIANAGIDQFINENTLVSLDASLSSDPESDQLAYLWTAPAGIKLSSLTTSKPTFTAPEVIVNTDYTFSLVVNDGKVNSIIDNVVVTIKQVNKAPIAHAGKDQEVNEGILVALDGTVSKDPENNTLTYSWLAPTGITLSSANASKPTFHAPEILTDTYYSFYLTVSDGFITSTTDTISIMVKNIDKLPYVKDPIKNVVLDKRSPDQLIDLKTVFADDDLDAVLSYSVTSNTNEQVVTTKITGSELTLYISTENIGFSEIEITVSSNGKEATSKFEVEVKIPTGIELNPTINQELIVFPNPTTGKIKLVLDQLPQNGTYLTVSDVTGRMILKQFIQSKEQWIDLKGNTPGVYLINTNLKGLKVQKVILK